MGSNVVRVAAVQCESLPGDPEGNLARAERGVRAAAAEKAALVLCPELLAAGYVYDASLWEASERKGGRTESWLCRLAARHRLHVGATYLEVDGDDFYNTFALASPDGAIAGRVRKESLPAFESWFFRSCAEGKVIDTELGRISVGICQDNHTARFMSRVGEDRPQLILMPHSGPVFPGGRRLVEESHREIGVFFARAFGVPVVMVNKVGSRTWSPVPGIPFVRVPFTFSGLSSIVDGDGRVLVRGGYEEEVLVADVHLGAGARPTVTALDPYWSRPPRKWARLSRVLLVTMEKLGRRAYRRSRTRLAAARASSA